MKAFIATLALSTGLVVGLSGYADAQSYNSQRARQDREYKSLSAATQRAYGTSTSSSSYRAPTTSSGYRRP